MYFKFLAASTLVFLTACASLNEEACRQGDWETIGYNDGVRGRYQSYINEHREACGEFGIAPNSAVWLKARLEGLKVYCTPDNAYDIGRRGNELNSVCPVSEFGDLRFANFYGLRYHEIDQEIDAQTEELKKIILLLETTPDLDPELEAFYLARIRSLDRKIFKLERELLKYARLP